MNRASWIAVAFSGALVASLSAAAADSPTKPGDSMPPLTVDLVESSQAGGEFHATPIATWGGAKTRLFLFVLPSHRASDLELADLRAFASTLGNKVGIAIVTVPKPGITTPEQLRTALGSGAEGLPVFRDAGFALASSLGIGSAPSYVLVDSDGTLRVLGAKALAAPMPDGGTFADYLRSGAAKGNFATVATLPTYKPNQRLVGHPYTDLSLMRIDAAAGSPQAKLSDFVGKGRSVLLVFWSARCPHCTKEMPHFAATATRYADRLQLVTVARTFDAGMEQETRQYLSSNSLAFPVMVDATGDAMERYLVNATPTSVLIKPDGNVAAIESGEIENLGGWLDRYLAPAP